MKVKETEKWMNLSGNEYRFFLSNAKLEILTMVTLSDKMKKTIRKLLLKFLKFRYYEKATNIWKDLQRYIECYSVNVKIKW